MKPEAESLNSTEKEQNIHISFFDENKYIVPQGGNQIMVITTTQLKENQAYYLSLASREDIIVTKNGKFYVRITGARQQAVASVANLFGILPSDVDEESLLKERALNK